MRERYIRNLQKNRHMAEISYSLLGNPIFKNLSRRERNTIAKLIYKAELLDIELRSKESARVMSTFQEIMDNIEEQLRRDEGDDFDGNGLGDDDKF